MEKRIPEVQIMYCSSNGVWFDPGHYIVFSSDYRPGPAWDNTTRAWYIDARAAEGKIIFTDP
jgi:hypothetical protein